MKTIEEIKIIAQQKREEINKEAFLCSGQDEDHLFDLGFYSGYMYAISQEKVFQLCPKCNGQGIVSKPPHISGDVFDWSSNSNSFECNLCNGKKII